MNNYTSGNKQTSNIFEIVTIVLMSFIVLIFNVLALANDFAPIILYFLMLLVAILLISSISNKEDVFIKIKLFSFFFSIYLLYTLMNHYILLDATLNNLPYVFLDEPKFYNFSDLGLPYVSGEKRFFDLFSVYKVHQLPLHVVFSSLITYFSTLIDGHNTIIVQKLLSPFFGALFSVVLFSTLKNQFNDYSFVLKATIGYGLLSAVFMYSTLLLRDIDVALAYMIAFYLFLEKNSYRNFFLLLLIAFLTIFLRVESGMVLFGVTILYSYLYVRTLESRSIKLIFYILLMVLFSLVVLLLYNRIIGMIVGLDESNIARGIAGASAGSISLLFNKLPFGLSHFAKMLFGQLQPFPFFLVIEKRPIESLSGLLWPFVFIMMIYTVIKKDNRDQIDLKVKYLLIVAIIVLLLMSSEANTRRMMSVYPIIYIAALYVFYFLRKDEIKRMFFYYLFGIITLNVVYYLIKI